MRVWRGGGLQIGHGAMRNTARGYYGAPGVEFSRGWAFDWQVTDPTDLDRQRASLLAISSGLQLNG